MCRWLAYTGNPLQLETVLFNAKHSLIDPSLHSQLGQTTTNGDRFGTSFRHLHELYPDDPRITAVGEDAFLVLSEPLADLPGWWEEIPESTAVVARGGGIEQYSFTPKLV